MKEILITIVIGYALGNIQAAYIFGKIFYKVDIRTLGHGNAGTSNALSSVGVKLGAAVAIVDVLKGLLAVLITQWLFKATLSTQPLLLYISGVSAMLGHIFPFYMHFKGGKGTATYLGAMLAMSPMLGVISIVFLLLLTYITDYIALSTMVLMSLIAVISFIEVGPLEGVIASLVLLSSMVMHRKNFARMKDDTEGRLSHVLQKKKG